MIQKRSKNTFYILSIKYNSQICITYKIFKIMKHVFIVNSLNQDDFLVFGTRKRAEEWIKHFDKELFDKSSQEDLYVTSRIVF